MSSDPKQRQKRIAKKTAKGKILSAAKKTIHQAGINWEAIKQMTAAAASPLYESLVAETLFDEGLGNVIFSRKMRNGLIAAGVFLVDVFCLGVKDCFFTVLSPLDYQNFLDRSSAHGALETWHPTCTVKLIRDAVAYAGDLGFKPYPDLAFTKKILGEVDPSLCPKSFEFGRNGKPCYITGPHETQKDIKRIMDTLSRNKGSDGFDYQVAVGEDTD